jgi:hypothetical protein
MNNPHACVSWRGDELLFLITVKFLYIHKIIYSFYFSLVHILYILLVVPEYFLGEDF